MKLKRTGLAFTAVLLLGVLAQAQTFTTLYIFTGGSDGANPYAGVIQDEYGNLYGTTLQGGFSNMGVVYQVSTAGTETVVHSFSGSDGWEPLAPVIQDEAGSLYGTTYMGGSLSDCDSFGCGTVFKIDTTGNETVLYNFKGGSDGCYPEQSLVMDGSGSLYGTTIYCASYDRGTIFKLDSAGKLTVLHSFRRLEDSEPVYGHLTMDGSGNLYGVTAEGGAGCVPSGCGVLYRLSTNGTFTVLHSFRGGKKDGCRPFGSVARDEAGDLYGTTYRCGSSNDGTVWRVSKTGKKTILHNFAGGTSDGCNPQAGVSLDSGGNLYGVTRYCGANNVGAVYQLSASGTLTLLHSFGSGLDGSDPIGEVLLTTDGTLLGTTANTWGTVWEYTP